MDIMEHFDSIAKMMKVLRERKVNNSAMKYENGSVSCDKEFSGTESLEQAYDLLENGWTEKLAEVKKDFVCHAKLNASMSVSRIRPSTGVVGYAPCVPNAILGLPNSMIASDRITQKVKAVSIVYGTSVDSGWTKSSMIKCGVEVMKLVNNLELNGYRVKLVQEVAFTKGNRDTASLFVDLKDYRQQLDLKKLLFPVINPSMLRRIFFKWLETVPDLKDTGFREGYGSPQPRDYDKHKENLYSKYKYIGDNEYYINAYMVKEEKYDIEKIMKRAGMKNF